MNAELIGLIFMAVMCGLCLTSAYMLVKTKREMLAASGEWEEGGAAEGGETRGALAPGSRRTSKCHALVGRRLRQRDASYVAGWTGELQPTMLGHDDVVDHRYDILAQLLAAEKPVGSVIEFRLACHGDAGALLAEHDATQAPPETTHAPARDLHACSVNYYRGRARQGAYRNPTLSVWTRVPTNQPGDNMNNGLAAFWRFFREELRVGGWRSLLAAFTSAYEDANGGTKYRFVREEVAAVTSAERTFRLVEREGAVLGLKRLDQGALWEGVYYGHNESATSAPTMPDDPRVDISGYLCNDDIRGDEDDNYVMHGNTPVAMVTLFTPPEPFAHAGLLRTLVGNPNLNFRHTVVARFVHQDKAKCRGKLGKRMRRIVKASTKPSGRVKLSEEAERTYLDLKAVKTDLTSSTRAMGRLFFFVLVYGRPAATRDERLASVRELEENCERVMQAIRLMPGADAAREDGAALRALYPGTLVGELDATRNEREIEEMTPGLAKLIPTEGSFRGSRPAHTFMQTVGNELFGLNLFQTEKVSSPLGVVLGNMGSGKSVFMARIINDVLSYYRHARVVAVDFGESFGVLAEMIGGRRLRFSPDERRTINVWDYEGLADGIMPDPEQEALVVTEIMKLARVPEADVISQSIIETCVHEVYEREVAFNEPGGEKHEPTLSHFLNMLQSYRWRHDGVRSRAVELAVILGKYRGHQWLDQPTHKDFAEASPFDWFELDSLERFPNDIRNALAYRVYARVIRTIGQKVDGEVMPTLLVFDEMHKIVEKYPDILLAIKKGARQGRKENVVTLLATHSYDDLSGIHDITANAGFKFIGKQIGNIDSLVRDAELSEAAAGAVRAIRNVPGSHAQYVLVFGSGADQRVEMVQVDLSDEELWAYTTHPVERNARERVRRAKPRWHIARVVIELAARFPRGLAFEGKTDIDISWLPQDAVEELVSERERYVQLLLSEIERLSGENAIFSRHIGEEEARALLASALVGPERRVSGVRGMDSTAVN